MSVADEFVQVAGIDTAYDARVETGRLQGFPGPRAHSPR